MTDKVETASKGDTLLFSKVFMVIGLLMFFAGNAAAGALTTFGSLAFIARTKQVKAVSKRWNYVEVVSIVIVLLHIALGVVDDNWYNKPFTFVIIPIVVLVAYGSAYLKSRR